MTTPRVIVGGLVWQPMKRLGQWCGTIQARRGVKLQCRVVNRIDEAWTRWCFKSKWGEAVSSSETIELLSCKSSRRHDRKHQRQERWGRFLKPGSCKVDVRLELGSGSGASSRHWSAIISLIYEALKSSWTPPVGPSPVNRDERTDCGDFTLWNCELRGMLAHMAN